MISVKGSNVKLEGKGYELCTEAVLVLRELKKLIVDDLGEKGAKKNA